MHEFTMANSIAGKIMEIVKEKGAKKICGIELLMGEQCMIGEEQITFWIKEILNSKVQIADDFKVELKPVKESRDCILNNIQLEI